MNSALEERTLTPIRLCRKFFAIWPRFGFVSLTFGHRLIPSHTAQRENDLPELRAEGLADCG